MPNMNGLRGEFSAAIDKEIQRTIQLSGTYGEVLRWLFNGEPVTALYIKRRSMSGAPLERLEKLGRMRSVEHTLGQIVTQLEYYCRKDTRNNWHLKTRQECTEYYRFNQVDHANLSKDDCGFWMVLDDMQTFNETLKYWIEHAAPRYWMKYRMHMRSLREAQPPSPKYEATIAKHMAKLRKDAQKWKLHPSIKTTKV